MPSFLSKFPSVIQSVIVKGAEEIAGAIWHTITGEHDNTSVSSVVTHAAEELAQATYQQMQNKLGAVALELELKKLGARAAEMQTWADDIVAKIKKQNEDDRVAFSMPTVTAFDNSDTPVDDDSEKK